MLALAVQINWATLDVCPKWENELEKEGQFKMSNNPQTILIVGHNPRNVELLEQFLKKENFKTTSATTLDAFRKILEDGVESWLPLSALIDIAGFNQLIWGPIEDLRARGIPFLLISAGNENRSIVQEEGAKRGAAGVLIKPLIIKDLLRVIKTLVIVTFWISFI